MNSSIFTKLSRLFFALALIAIAGFAAPRQALAASPFIDIAAVKADESVTIHATGLPAGMNFTARMGLSGTNGVNGTTVGETKSASDGTFTATYAIPAALKGKSVISIRIDSATGGWYAYNAFINKTQGTTSSTPAPTTTPGTSVTPTPGTTGPKMYVEVTAVEKNKRISVRATGFPANTDFKVRIGPFATFATQQKTVTSFNTGKGGTLTFNVDLPDLVKDVSKVTIRVDAYTTSGHLYAYNVFTNNPSGTVSGSPTPTPTTTTPAPVTPTAGYKCEVISKTPTTSIPTPWDFDVIWEVKNSGTQVWPATEVDYRYQSGEKMHKFSEPYDLPKTVQPGETVKLLVDMRAPSKVGTYNVEFALAMGRTAFCSLPISIVVK